MAEKKQTTQTEETTEEKKPKYQELLKTVKDDFQKLESYFTEKIRATADKYKKDAQYPLLDFIIEFNSIKAQIQQQFSRLDILPDGIDKAREKCDNIERKQQRIKDF